MATVACVLRHGGAYDATYVKRLYAGVARHCPPGTEFVLLTDEQWCGDCGAPRRMYGAPLFRVSIVYSMPPGWWGKMSLFQPGRFSGRVLYIDLDSVITDRLDTLLAYDGPPLILRDFNEGKTPRLVDMVGGAVITWTGDEMAGIWEAFQSDPVGVMADIRYRRSDSFIRDHMPANTGRIQDVFPGLVACAKEPLKGMKTPGLLPEMPKGAAIVTSWGNPRVHELPASHWMRAAWEGRAA